jgi:DNA-damage-inducible protein D
MTLVSSTIQDVVQLLTDTSDVKDYIEKMKKRDLQLNSNWGTICPLIEMVAVDNFLKRRKENLEEKTLNLKFIHAV